MNRREYLGLIGAGSIVTFAGCLGDDDDDSEPDDGVKDNSDDDGQTDDERNVEVVAGDYEMRIEDAVTGQRPHTVVPIENVGGNRSGQITLSVEYFDYDDRFAGESSTRVATLRPGETWIAEDIGRNIDGDTIQSAELDLSVTKEPPERHQEIEFFDTVYRNGNGLGGRITGGVTNTGEEAVEFEIIARLFDSEGRVTGDWVFSKGEIDPQEERNMEIPVVGNMGYERAGENPEFELIPIETGFVF